MTTVGAALAAAARRLRAAGVPAPRLDARVLIAHLLGIEPVAVMARPEQEMPPEAVAELDAMVARRGSREPVSRILGLREFWSLPFRISADTLDPRPDTETVVEAVLEWAGERTRPLRILDLGTGSGCLLLALLHEMPAATGVGVDRSAAACRTARDNAVSLGLAERVSIVSGDWGRGIDGRFDVIVANPPYIPDEDIARLEPEVAEWEPRGALAGGADGLDCYRALAPDVARLLAPAGLAALEVGAGQAAAVATILEGVGLRPSGVKCDLAGVERCVLATRRKPAFVKGART